MNKEVILVILALFLILPNCFAWQWETHQGIAEKLYDDMPRELQQKLNLSLMKEGSIAPDKVFHDNIFHNYPKSYTLALIWLNKGGNWDNTSYNFGVAIHYISDSFSAPHYIIRESSKDHTEFERQAKNYIPKTKCSSYNLTLKEGMETGSLNYKDWGEWLLNKNKEIPEKEVDDAMKLVYSVAFDKFNFACNKKTEFEYSTEYFSSETLKDIITFFGALLLLNIVYRIIKRFKYKK